MQAITTRYGILTPQHTTDDLRKKEVLPVTYHENGEPRSIPLEIQSLVTTPAGDIPAELITLHENGFVNRVFPLNGRLSGYWGEEDETMLAEPITVNTPVGPMTARFISVCFYDTGMLRSMTLWPGETLTVETSVGFLVSRIGVSFTKDGKLRSIEPAKPTLIDTPVGDIEAFDPDAIGVNGDDNSLVFGPDGRVERLRTTRNTLSVVSPDGQRTEYSPSHRDSYCSDTAIELEPMEITFGRTSISVRKNLLQPAVRIPKAKHAFFVRTYLPQLECFSPLGTCSLQSV